MAPEIRKKTTGKSTRDNKYPRMPHLFGQLATQFDRGRAVLERALHKAQQLADRVVDLAQIVGADDAGWLRCNQKEEGRKMKKARVSNGILDIFLWSKQRKNVKLSLIVDA